MLTKLLKAKTLSSHRELEKHVTYKIKGIRTVDDYIHLLQIFHLYFGSLESQIKPFLQADFLPDIHDRRHAKRLAEDISILGGTPLMWKDETAVPRIGSWQEALGALYVMEGSTLGGKFIIKMVTKQAQIAQGFSFFSAYGPYTAERWAQFQETINARVVESQDIDRTVAAAHETFTYFATFIKKHE